MRTSSTTGRPVAAQGAGCPTRAPPQNGEEPVELALLGRGLPARPAAAAVLLLAKGLMEGVRGWPTPPAAEEHEGNRALPISPSTASTWGETTIPLAAAALAAARCAAVGGLCCGVAQGGGYTNGDGTRRQQ